SIGVELMSECICWRVLSTIGLGRADLFNPAYRRRCILVAAIRSESDNSELEAKAITSVATRITLKVCPMPVDTKYKTTATASGGGRDGRTALADGTMSFDLVIPKELGGPGGDGANPEKLFALGYSACFLSAMRTASVRTKI